MYLKIVYKKLTTIYLQKVRPLNYLLNAWNGLHICKTFASCPFSFSFFIIFLLSALLEPASNNCIFGANLGSPVTSASHVTGSSSSSRCFAARRSRKGWKRRYYLQQRARQERLNNSRKWKVGDHAELSTEEAATKCKPCKHSVPGPQSHTENSSAIPGPDSDKKGQSGKIVSVKDDNISSRNESEIDYCDCVPVNSVEICKDGENDCTEHDASLDSTSDGARLQDECSTSALCNSTPNSKRHSDRDLDNPKPSKSRRPIDDHSDLSSKYSSTSFCSIDDHLPDGFYDAGRDRPFMPLRSYEQILHLDSREVILLDR